MKSRLRAELERRPIEWLALDRTLGPKLDLARAALCAVVGSRPEDLVFVNNATGGVNAVLRSAAFQPGDEIVFTDHGHNTPRVGRSRFQTEFDWPGTYDPTPYLSLPKALDWLAAQRPQGLAGVMQHNHQLVLAARELLCAELGVTAPAPEAMLGSLASISLPDDPAPQNGLDPLGMHLYEHYQIEAPIIHWPRAGQRWVRISAQLYNDEDDYRQLAKALRKELKATADPYRR